MGVEGFSHGTSLKDMNAVVGNKNEYLWLFALLGLIPLLAQGRKSNEDGLQQQVKTTNKFSKLTLDDKSA